MLVSEHSVTLAYLWERDQNLRIVRQIERAHREREVADYSLYLLELFGGEDMNGAGGNGAGRAATRLPPMHVQPYDGDPRRLKEFRRTLHIVFAANPGLTGDEQLAIVIGLLSGNAKGWWMSKPDNYAPAGWVGLLNDLQNELLNGSRYALWGELQLRALRAGESLDTYKYDIANLCEMLGLQAQEQVGCFIRGLPEHVRNSVAGHDPADLDAAALIAKRIVEYSTPTPLRPTTFSPQFTSVFGDPKPWEADRGKYEVGRERERGRDDDLTKGIADLTQQLGQITLHLLKEKEREKGERDGRGYTQGPRGIVPRSFGTGGQIICGKCLKAGHIQRNCTNPPDPSAVRCNNCSFYGHKESECRKPPRPKTSKSNLLELVSSFGAEKASEPLIFDDGHEDGPSDESILHSGLMGLTLESPVAFPPVKVWSESDEVACAPLCVDSDVVLPPCELWNADDEPVSAPLCVETRKKVRFELSDYESDVESESSFEVTSSENEDASFLAQPEGKSLGKRSRKPVPLQKEMLARMRELKEDQEDKKEHRKDVREERRLSNYRVLDAIVGSQVPLLSEVGGKLPYFRKDMHDWVDHKILRYIPRKRISPKDAALTKLQPPKETSPPPPESHGAWVYSSKATPSAASTHGQLRYILAKFGEVSVPAVVDTGSQISVISYAFAQELGVAGRIDGSQAPRFTGSDLQSHKSRGTVYMTMSLGKMRVGTVFTVVDGPSSCFKVLIGQDILGPTYASCCNETMQVRFKLSQESYVYCPFIKLPKNF